MEAIDVSMMEKGRNKREAIYSLALIYNIIHGDIAGYLKKFNLTPGKFNILAVLRKCPDQQGMRQVKISKNLIVTPSNMTKLIQKLETDGLVVRSDLEGDKRVNITRITRKGLNVVDQAWEGYNQILINCMNRLDGNNQKQLAGLLSQWLRVLK